MLSRSPQHPSIPFSRSLTLAHTFHCRSLLRVREFFPLAASLFLRGSSPPSKTGIGGGSCVRWSQTFISFCWKLREIAAPGAAAAADSTAYTQTHHRIDGSAHPSMGRRAACVVEGAAAATAATYDSYSKFPPSPHGRPLPLPHLFFRFPFNSHSLPALLRPALCACRRASQPARVEYKTNSI